MAATSNYKSVSDGAVLTVDGGTLRIQFWSPGIVRVTYSLRTELPALKSLSVVASPEKVHLIQQQSGQTSTVSSEKVRVKVDNQTGAITFLDAANHVLLQETVQGRKIEAATVSGASVTSAA
jgi:alpha-D-xyloside xylohydrolase